MSLKTVAERFVPDAVSDYRARALARFIVMVCFASCPLWIGFAFVAIAIGLPQWCALAFLAFFVAQLAIPLLVRKTGSTYVAMLALGTLAYAGITLVAVLDGGFPFQVLLFTLVLPVTAATQRLHRSQVPIWAGLCVAQYVVWFALAATGHAPDVLVLSETARQLVCASVLVCWLGLMLLISAATSLVTYEFADARDALQHAVLQSQKLDALGKVTTGIENSFNNALMSMDYTANLLGQSLAHDDVLQNEIAELKDAVVRSKTLSRKLERLGRADEDVRIVNVDEAIERLETSLRRLIHDKVTLTMPRQGTGAAVRCGANQLDQVLVNLVVNASDAMAHGGELAIVTRTTPDTVIIEVRDAGSGIPATVLPHIFEPFFTTKDRETGTGLGLWICSSIVRSCGGTLAAESVVGAGTTMRVVLPRASADRAADRPQLAATSSGRQGQTQTRLRMQPLPAAASWRALSWFAEGVTDRRARVRGIVISAIALSTIPFWIGFGVYYWIRFGWNAMTWSLLLSAALCAVGPLLLRLTRSPRVTAMTLAGIPFVTLSSLAILRGGFQIQILVWLAIVPVAGTLQKELRHFARNWSAAVFALYALIYALAAAGVLEVPVVDSPFDQLVENFVVLISLLGLFLLIFRTASTVTERFAIERDAYEATLLESQDFASLGAFAGSIAHDLNNVLTTVEFSTSILEEDLPRQHPNYSDIADLKSAGTRIKELARQLTRFGRAGHDDKTEPMVAATVIAQLEPMLRPILGSHIGLRLVLDSAAAAILSRSNALDQVIINLALNARDAMPDGGIWTITTGATAEAVTISLSDTGVGIPAPILPAVCEPFFTTDADRVGLGLWVCREIVGEARGDLTIDSEPGRGTTVRLSFPRARPSKPSRPREQWPEGTEPKLRAHDPRPPAPPSTPSKRHPSTRRPGDSSRRS